MRLMCVMCVMCLICSMCDAFDVCDVCDAFDGFDVFDVFDVFDLEVVDRKMVIMHSNQGTKTLKYFERIKHIKQIKLIGRQPTTHTHLVVIISISASSSVCTCPASIRSDKYHSIKSPSRIPKIKTQTLSKLRR